ncbi:hypothetical protein SS50377_27025 [Spironucleus salmonicida]|uniref:Uncharacterized protein n=1 Tax=Spironucleus salmonicida TaxID=348837 RepID=A0A9P8LM79_9EUKA|nr:hypothetical protein SS50377_27025 [Spironucleus salmonicida]
MKIRTKNGHYLRTFYQLLQLGRIYLLTQLQDLQEKSTRQTFCYKIFQCNLGNFVGNLILKSSSTYYIQIAWLILQQDVYVQMQLVSYMKITDYYDLLLFKTVVQVDYQNLGLLFNFCTAQSTYFAYRIQFSKSSRCFIFINIYSIIIQTRSILQNYLKPFYNINQRYVLPSK